MSLTDPVIPIVLVYLVLQSPLVVCAAWFAPKMKARRSVWVALTAIPWLGLLIGYVLILRAFCAVLDAVQRKNQLMHDELIERRLGQSSVESIPLDRSRSNIRASRVRDEMYPAALKGSLVS